jgi:hypothetical protein
MRHEVNEIVLSSVQMDMPGGFDANLLDFLFYLRPPSLERIAFGSCKFSIGHVPILGRLLKVMKSLTRLDVCGIESTDLQVQFQHAARDHPKIRFQGEVICGNCATCAAPSEFKRVCDGCGATAIVRVCPHSAAQRSLHVQTCDCCALTMCLACCKLSTCLACKRESPERSGLPVCHSCQSAFGNARSHDFDESSRLVCCESCHPVECIRCDDHSFVCAVCDDGFCTLCPEETGLDSWSYAQRKAFSELCPGCRRDARHDESILEKVL